ncbi:MAG: sialate O-acetylesterase, partial [Aeoliella sp.]
ALLVVLAASTPVPAENLDVYILTGQSNSLGTTNLEGAGFDPGVHPADAQTEFFWSNVSTSSSDPNNIVLYGDSGGAITTLQMQQGASPSPNFWGPEFGMARTLFDSGNSNVMVIKASRGGGGNQFWLPTTGHMHNHVLAQVDAGLTAAENAGHTFDVKGFMYLQGESNNGAGAAAADTRLQTLIDDVQTHINTNYAGAAANMYSVIGEIAASTSNANRAMTTNLQQALAASSSSIGFIPTRDQPLKSDGIHFGRNSKLEIGRRFGDAFNSRSWVEGPNVLAGYSANQGSADAVPHPIVQGLTELGGIIPGVTLDEINDGGTPAWRVVDNSRNANPGYQQALDAPDFQQMFDQGWNLKATAKVISGGGLALWGVDTGNDPGWGIAGGSGNLNGFQLSRVNGDELEVGLWQNQTPVNLGPGSADLYHTFELRGAAGSSLFNFYIDGQLQSTGHDLTTGTGFAGFENSLTFNSGTSGGTGLEVYWNEVSLTVVPEPASVGLLSLSMAFFAVLAAQRL